MTEPISLPPGVALGIIAFLLSLLPAGFFIWLLYLRRQDRSIKPSTIAYGFLAGMVLVLPAFWLEDKAGQLWRLFSPETAHFFAGAVLPLTRLQDVLLPALGTFLVVATVEEGLRYALLRVWLRRSSAVDQVFDGLLVGLALGLGFATLENTIYFLQLFETGRYDTLVFVFFLRFVISTLAHVSFAGIMGTLITRGVFDFFHSRRYYVLAFGIPWLLHGLYDLLLGIDFSFYAVLLLVPALGVFVAWTQRRDFTIVHRKEGELLAAAEAPRTREMNLVRQMLQTMDSPWNKEAPWLSQSRSLSSFLDTIEDDDKAA